MRILPTVFGVVSVDIEKSNAVDQAIWRGGSFAAWRGSFASLLGIGFTYYYLTSLLVVLDVIFGHGFLRHPFPTRRKPADVLECFAQWDGYAYKQIAIEGYSYQSSKASNVAFFPAYPLLGHMLARATGLRPVVSLLLISHLFLLASFVLLVAYVHKHYDGVDTNLPDNVLLSLGLFPASFFFRMAYTESLFLFLILLFMYGCERKWPAIIPALVAGAATATRAVGICLLLPFLIHLWNRPRNSRDFLLYCLLYLPLACAGLIFYMGYQWYEFGDPFVFAKTQWYYRVHPPASLPDRLTALATLAPIWRTYDPSAPCYWRDFDSTSIPIFSLQWANPLYFLLAFLLLFVGAWKRWLSAPELVLSFSLLLVPYLTRGPEMCCAGFGRFTSVVLPIYLVIGRLLCLPRAQVVACLAALSGFLSAVYAAFFSAAYRFW